MPRTLLRLQALGIDTRAHDVRFVEDNWESPVLGAWGLGWEVWLDGMEVTQFTYFQVGKCGESVGFASGTGSAGYLPGRYGREGGGLRLLMVLSPLSLLPPSPNVAWTAIG